MSTKPGALQHDSDPRSPYQADAFEFGREGHPTELEAMLAEGWTVANPAVLDKLGLGHLVGAQ